MVLKNKKGQEIEIESDRKHIHSNIHYNNTQEEEQEEEEEEEEERPKQPKSSKHQQQTQKTPKQQVTHTSKQQTSKQTPKETPKQQTPNNKNNDTVINIDTDSEEDERIESNEHIEYDEYIEYDNSETEKYLEYLKTKSIILDKDGNYPPQLTKKEILFWTKKNFKIETLTVGAKEGSYQLNSHLNNIDDSSNENNTNKAINNNNNINNKVQQTTESSKPPIKPPTQQTVKKQRPKQQEREEEKPRYSEKVNKIRQRRSYSSLRDSPIPELPPRRSTKALLSTTDSASYFNLFEESKLAKKSATPTQTKSNNNTTTTTNTTNTKKSTPSIPPPVVSKRSKIVTPPMSDADSSSDNSDHDNDYNGNDEKIIIDPNVWSPNEIEKLKKVTNRLKTTDYNYWDRVSEYVETKTAEQCQKQHNSNFKSPNPKKSSSTTSKQLSPISMKTKLNTNKGKRKLRQITEMNTLVPKKDLFDATPFKNKKKISYVGSSDIDSDDGDLFNDSVEARDIDKMFSEVHVDLSESGKDIENKVGKDYWDGYITRSQNSSKKLKSAEKSVKGKKNQQQPSSSSYYPTPISNKELRESVNVISKISNKYDKIKEKDNHQLDLDESREDSYFGDEDEDLSED